MPSSAILIEELSSALADGTAERRSEVLRRVTDLFLANTEMLGEEHVGLFDDVMLQLVETVERYALIRLGLQLAPVRNAPLDTIGRLASDDDIGISGPVLERSPRVSDALLVEVARSKGQAHLAAIAAREHLSEVVTDIVVERGDLEVTRKVTANTGARFSDAGLRTIAARAHADEELAELLAGRSDVPPDIFCDMVRDATGIVRHRLAASAHPAVRTRLDHAIAAIGDQLVHARLHAAHHGPAVRIDPDGLKVRLCEHARQRQRGPVIEDLAAVADVPVIAVRNLIRQRSADALLILCKAAGLGWSDARAVLETTLGEPEDPRAAFQQYIRLTGEVAQRVVRFIKLRKSASRSELDRLM
ncbi:DUF2336 domain-containing protein [Rhodoplanes sp. TEM]|uniref:DUF2336 domain-containing protein n=1 Tax=Rhodoplanes tepidamans TaxID=200616 RepID=A0ABT5J5H1_RHOTP|nr:MULTISPECIES: DUF2336 domain-containing protein [Rhodoplanes]MDC7784549.1 DUF2336 domain-containing protein [Rhodoplanes tepidamans]MDC7984456.1 DUF2336 domain-containing protein [Rhodoplanes sp. TEM]MDQ0355777.1 uncharacterized protein (DUF2336 family) [Rhodoplanes tepidamans]